MRGNFEPRAEILGQILLIESVVANLPDEGTVFEFVCRGLEPLPGVARVSYQATVADEAPLSESHQAFALKVDRQAYGALVVEIADSDSFSPYAPYLANLAFMLAVVLDGRRQPKLNESLTADLEQRIEVRTRELRQEIEDRQHAQAELERSQANLSLLAEATWEAIVIHVDGVVLQANGQYFSMFGYEADELIGKDAIPLTVASSSLQTTRSRVAAGDLGPYETVGRRKNGSEFPIEIRARMLSLKGRRVRVTAIRDLSERKHMEQQALQSQKLEALGNLAGGIAHDFNNILMAVMGHSQLGLADARTGSNAEAHFRKIAKAGERAKDLVRQIMTFSRQSTADRAPTNVAAVAQEALSLLRATLPTTIEICQDLSSTGAVLAGPSQIHQILLNLCTNSGLAMPSGGVLTVSTEDIQLDETTATGIRLKLDSGPHVRLAVSDTGCGMPLAIQRRVFEPFFTTREQGDGTGLGLSVVHGIVQSLGGAIGVTSTPDQGTTFELILPSAADPVPEPTRPCALQEGAQRILLVDDEESVVDVSTAMLESIGYAVTGMTSSLDALERIRDDPHAFDLVVTDKTMPGLPGDRLAVEILGIRPDMPIMLCTGYGTETTEARAMAIGIKVVATKPIAIKAFGALVREALAPDPKAEA